MRKNLSKTRKAIIWVIFVLPILLILFTFFIPTKFRSIQYNARSEIYWNYGDFLNDFARDFPKGTSQEVIDAFWFQQNIPHQTNKVIILPESSMGKTGVSYQVVYELPVLFSQTCFMGTGSKGVRLVYSYDLDGNLAHMMLRTGCGFSVPDSYNINP